MSVLQQSIEDGICTLTLDRPDSLNAFNGTLIDEFRTAARELDGDDTVSCVVVEGAGDAFSAGGDINRMKNRIEEDRPAAEFREQLRTGVQAMVKDLYHLSVPTIAKIEGVISGMGVSLALACDLLFAARGSRFSLSFCNVALGPDTGASYLLPERIGTHRALELAYTGQEIDAERAAEMGLVNRTLPPDELEEVVDDIARDLADGPRLALAATKRLMKAGPDSSLEDALEAETSSQAFLYASDDHKEGVQAFLQRREPEFTGT
jgi:enoyl-CoA hydratase/carnithine racemase